MWKRWVLLLAWVTGVAVGGGVAQDPPRPRITGVAFLRVYSTQPKAAQAFYGGLLGLERVQVGDRWAYPVNREQWIEVLPHTAPPRTADVFAGFGLTTGDVAGMERWLKAKGVAVTAALRDGAFSVTDPEGYSVTFVQAPETPAGAPLGGAPLAVSRMAPQPGAASRRMIHVGIIVHDRAREDAFYKGLLGFRPYWAGGSKPDRVDYVSQQVPDGHDWVEYMLSPANPPNRQNSGVLDHASLAVVHMEDALAALDRNGTGLALFKPMQVGADGKVQLNLYDPDGTRIEFMDYEPVARPCCSPFTAPNPSPADPY